MMILPFPLSLEKKERIGKGSNVLKKLSFKKLEALMSNELDLVSIPLFYPYTVRIICYVLITKDSVFVPYHQSRQSES